MDWAGWGKVRCKDHKGAQSTFVGEEYVYYSECSSGFTGAHLSKLTDYKL